MLGSVKAAAVLAHSVQLTQGLAPNTAVVMEGATVSMINGYPSAASVPVAAGVGAPDYSVGAVASVAGSARSPSLPTANIPTARSPIRKRLPACRLFSARWMRPARRTGRSAHEAAELK